MFNPVSAMETVSRRVMPIRLNAGTFVGRALGIHGGTRLKHPCFVPVLNACLMVTIQQCPICFVIGLLMYESIHFTGLFLAYGALLNSYRVEIFRTVSA